MAQGSAKDIKRRVKSIKNTRQITKAMELVASSRLKKARKQAESASQYFEALQVVMRQTVSGNNEKNIYLKSSEMSKRICHCVIAGDRGLAGGYNSNALKQAELQLEKNCLLLPIGKKAAEHFEGSYPFLSRSYIQIGGLTGDICMSAGRFLEEQYRKGIFDALLITYTGFINMLRQEPKTMQILPFEDKKREKTAGSILYEPSAEAVFKHMVPDYIGAVLYYAVAQSYVSELCARRNAMDVATKNADEMIETLTLQYNRARQSAITQEIAEIAAGANAGGREHYG